MMEPGRTPEWLGTTWQSCWFDGAWRSGAATITVIEPATGEQIATVGSPDTTEIWAIAARARDAQAAWAATPPPERAKVMRRAASILDANASEAVGWIIRESGSVGFKGGFEVQATVEELHVAAGLLIQADGMTLPSPDPTRSSVMRRVPLGVVAVITPWNLPLGLAIRSVAPALALGNAVILKPDPHTPVAGGVLLARVFEEAGLPAGVFTMVPGGADIGEALITAPAVRMVSFTGSTAAGRRVGELAGRHLKRVALELGGNCPMVVLADADVAAAASAGAFGSFFHQGQICMATSRHIVAREVVEEYVEILSEKAAALAMGSGLDPANTVGPLINRRQFDKVSTIVSQSVSQGARMTAGGPGKGLFFRPTVLSHVTPEMPAFVEEIFGPVAPVTIAENEEHAVLLANQTEYGLAAAVHTGDLDRGMRIARRLRAAMVHVNDQTINDNSQAPMGGMGQSGNGARFSCLTAWDEFTEWQWMTAGAAPVRYPY